MSRAGQNHALISTLYTSINAELYTSINGEYLSRAGQNHALVSTLYTSINAELRFAEERGHMYGSGRPLV